MPLPPFLAASSAEPSVYISVQTACQYFSSSISRVRAVCCDGICCSTGSKPKYLQEAGGFEIFLVPVCTKKEVSSLICGSRMYSCVLLRSLAKWLRLCLYNLFLVGAAIFLWSRWPGSLDLLRLVKNFKCSLEFQGLQVCSLLHFLDEHCLHGTNNGS